MENQQSIKKSSPDHPGFDFFALKQEGIERLQELSGKIWTDYNEHDPGVTLLEQLCFAITEMSYKASLDIPDILSGRNPARQGQPDLSDTFYPPAAVLTTDPVTINDYRKLILDQVPQLRNVWIEKDDAHGSALKGLYRVFIDVPENQDKDTIKENVREMLVSNRNLCEDFKDITILDPYYITIKSAIVLQKGVDADQVLADILFEVDNFLSPPVHAYSLDELLSDKKLALDKIFDGPLLKNGFTRDEESTPRITTVCLQDLLTVISKVSGVEMVRDLNIVVLQEGRIARVNPDINAHQIAFSRNNAMLQINRDRAGQLLEEKNMQFQSSLSDTTDVAVSNPPPSGHHGNHFKYYSIQHNFPEVYGIGQFGVPETASPQRKVQAHQLRGYVMLFEQAIACFTAKLAGVRKWYSLDQSMDSVPTKQALEGIPGLDDIWNAQDESKGSEENPVDQTRRNKLLDHLLARFGEEFDGYDLPVDSKVDLLKNIVAMVSERAKGINLLQKNGQQGLPYDPTGLEQNVNRWLNIRFGGNPFGNSYVVEHILLRPSAPQKPLYQVAIEVLAYNIIIQLLEGCYEEGIKDEVDNLLKHIPEYAISEENGKFLIYSPENQEKPIGEIRGIKKADPSSNYLKLEIENFAGNGPHSFNELMGLKGSSIKKNPFINYIAHYYNMRATIVLPLLEDETPEFSELREFIESLFLSYAPAHIRLEFCWLSSKRMQEFESLFSDWLTAYQSGNINPGLSCNLLAMLLAGDDQKEKQKYLDELQPYYYS